MLQLDLQLARPIYRETAAYGHFGRSEKNFTWEQLTRLEEQVGCKGTKDIQFPRFPERSTVLASDGRVLAHIYLDENRNIVKLKRIAHIALFTIWMLFIESKPWPTLTLDRMSAGPPSA